MRHAPSAQTGPAPGGATPGWLRWLVLGLLTSLMMAWAPGGAWAQAAPATSGQLLSVPPLSGRIVDQTGTLSAAQQAALSQQLAEIEQRLGSQIVVLLVPTLQGEDIAPFAYRVADQWKIGRRDVGDGVLIVVAKDDRRLRIEVARALEGAIPDLAASQIIERTITPAFKTGDYAGGLQQGITALAARIAGENLPAPDVDGARRGGGSGETWQDLGMFLFMGVPVVGAVLTAMLGRKLGSVGTGVAMGLLGWWWTSSIVLALIALVIAVVLVGAMGVGGGRGASRHGGWGGGSSGGGWGGGSSGGGFSSGGGGSFGGGGASGRW